MEGKRTKRSQTKYPGLVKEVSPKARWEYQDQDYADKLSDQEKEWLSNFNEEYYGGNFQHSGDIHHQTVEEKRACYTRNNARNRDLYAISRTRGWIEGINVDAVDNAKVVNPENAENTLVELLDLKDKVEKSE